MPSLREIRRKIQSVRSTQQITKAMKMVAAARMRRAQGSILSARPFAQELERTVGELAALERAAQEGEGRIGAVHPLFERRGEERPCLMMVTADKGLCGAFNANVLRAFVTWLKDHPDRPVSVFTVGKKARAFLRRLRHPGLEHIGELVGIFPKATFAHAEIAAGAVLERFRERSVSQVQVLYNEFKSAVAQRVVLRPLLPLCEARGEVRPGYGFKFEPARRELLDALLPRQVKAQVYRMLLESQAAELAARMNAMDAASSNASELIEGLTLSMNRTRQAMITRELAEIVGGAEVLSS